MKDKPIKNMEEFAALSGISRPTISKYFHQPNSVRPSTRARIEKAIAEFDYTPNIYAMNQNRKLTKTMGIVVPYLADPFFAEVARLTEQKCIEVGFSPTLFSAHGEQKLENEILETLESLKPAGVLLAPLGRASDKKAIEKFCKNVPTVLIDSNIEGMGSAFVGSDNASFVNQGVDYLTRSGSAPVFFEMKRPVNPNANKRRHAYVARMEKLNLKPQVISVEGDGWGFEEIGRQGALEVLSSNVLSTDTVLCSNDRLAIGFLSACWEKGVKVGIEKDSDLRVASQDDHPFSRFTCPPLTTAAHDYHSVASHSVETLLDLIEAGGTFKDRPEKLYPSRLILRASA